MKKTILALSLFILGWTAPLSAEVMTYQGRLKESNIPVSANRFFLFEFCNDEFIGSCTNTPSGPQSFTVQNGLFKSTFTLPASDLSLSPWYLQVSVGVTAPAVQPLSPRERLTAVPYSVHASSAGFASALSVGSGVGVISSTNVIVLGGLTVSDAGVQQSTTSAIEGYAVLADKTPGGEDIRVGVSGRVVSNSGDLLDIMAGGNFEAEVPAGMKGAMIGVRAANRNTGSSSLSVGVLVDSLENSGNIGDTYGIRIATLTQGAQTNKPYAIYSEDPNARSFFAGHIGISSRTPAYALSVSTGSGDLFWVADDGAHGSKFWGDGSGLTGVIGASGTDATKVLKTGDVMTGSLFMDLGSTITVSGSDFSVGGATLVVKAGYIGLGTNAPDARLHVVSDNGYVHFASPASGFTLNIIPANYTPATFNNNASGPLVFSIDNNQQVIMTPQQMVGIGPTVPSYRLHVSSGAGETGVIMAVSTGATNVFSVDGSGVTALKFTGDGSGITGLGSAAAAGTAANLVGGAIGEIPYQAAASTTAMLAAGLPNQLLQSNGSAAPMWTSAPTISGSQITGLVAANLTGTVPPASVNLSTVTSRLDAVSAFISSFTANTDGRLLKSGDTMTGQMTNTSSVTITGDGGGAYGLQVSSNISLAGAVYTANGNVGIGIAGPGAKLDVAGTGSFSGSLSTLSSGTFRASGAGQFSVETSSGILVQAGRIQVPALQLTNGAAADYVLTSDAAGNASWVNPGASVLGDSWVGNEIADAGDTTLTRSGTGTGVDPYKLKLNLSNPNTWTAGQIFSAGLAGGLTGAASDNVLKAGDTMTGQLTLANSTLTVTGNAFSVGGSTLIVKAGKVGIGISPIYPLDVVGDINTTGEVLLGSNKFIRFGGSIALSGAGSDTRVETVSDIAFRSSFVEKMRMTHEGALGIGTASPEAKLDVVSTATANSIFAQIWRSNTGIIVGSMSSTGSMQAARFVGDGSGITGLGAAAAAGTATNLAGGAIGEIPYQTAANTTAMLAAGPLNSLLQGSGSAAPMWTSAPTISGSQITGLVAANLTGTVPPALINLSTVTSRLDTYGLFLTTATIAIDDKLSRSGDTMTGQLTNASSITVTGSAFSVGGSTFIVTGGNVAIGTTTSSALLTIKDNIGLSPAVPSIILGNPVGGAELTMGQTSTQRLSLNWNASGYGEISTLGGALLLNMSGQNVGIGIQPQAKLEVAGGSVSIHGLVSQPYVFQAGDNGIVISTGGAIQTTGLGNGGVVGNARGMGAVDLQTLRALGSDVASGKYAVIAGGNWNGAAGNLSVVGGGFNNHADGMYATVPGGFYNTAGGTYSFAAGNAARAYSQGSFVWADSEGNYIDNNVTDRAIFKSRGGFIVTGSTVPVLQGTVNRGVIITGAGLVGISTGNPQAALDVVSTGTTVNQYAQIWRASDGVIKASVTATGAFYGDGSGLTGVSATDATKLPLAGGTMTGDINMAAKNLYAVSTITAAGDITAARYQINGSTVLAVWPGPGSLAVGITAGRSNTGLGNSFVGHGAGYSNTTGINNSFIGYGAGGENIAAGDNSFVGYSAGGSNTSGANNSFMGSNAGAANTTGAGNSFVGRQAGYSNLTGSDNVIFGDLAGMNGSFSSSTIIGSQAGFNLDGTAYNIFLGYKAGYAATTGVGNIVIGSDMDTSASGASNELNIGGVLYGDLSAKTIGISTRAPQAALDIVSTATASNVYAQIWRDGFGVVKASVTSLGVFSGDGSGLTGVSATDATKLPLAGGTMTGDINMAAKNLYAVSTITAAGDITAARYQIDGSTVLAVLPGLGSLGVGVQAGRVNTGNYNSFLGEGAGYSNTTGSQNSFLGYQAGYYNTTGNYNSFLGNSAGQSNTTGSNNSFLSYGAGQSNTTGSYNSFLGSYAGYSNTTGSNNSFLGYQAGFYNQTGAGNAVVGYNAGGYGAGPVYSFSSSTIMGYQAGYKVTTGNDNILLGWQAGYNVTSGTGNIVIGYNKGTSGATANNELNIGGVLYGDLSAKTIGISTRVPQAALDIVSTATAANVYAQIWRDGSGVVKASVTSLGVFSGDGSGLTGVSATDATKLPLSGGIMSGQLTNTSSVTITGNGGGAYGLEVSSNISLAGSLYSANGKVGIGAPIPAGLFQVGGGSLTVLSSGNVGLGTTAPGARLELYNSAVNEDTTIKINNQANAGYAASLRLANATNVDWYINVGGSGRGDYMNSAFTVGENTIGHTGTRFIIKQEGNVGIGTTGPSYRLHVSSGAGETGTVMAVSTGSTNLFWVAGDGAHALKYYGDGSGLTNLALDNTKLPLAGGTMTGTLAMGGNHIYSVSTITATGDITAARYQINGSTVLAVLPGADSLGVGVQAGRLNTGVANSFLGYQAGYSNTTGGYNSFLGSYAGYSNTTGINNSFLGLQAGYSNTTGSSNSFLGYVAGNSNTTGSFNSFLGPQAGYLNTTGDSNSFLGFSAGYSNTTGNNNSFLGSDAGSFNTTGSFNSFLGYRAGYYNQTGAGNAVVGYGAGGLGSGGFNSFSSSTIVGSEAGYNVTTGNDNIFLGWRAGYNVTNGAGNIVIGYNKNTSAAVANNELNIGGVLYGDLSAKTIGISTRAPQAALDIVSTATASNVYAQIWRDGSGVVKASVTSLGVFSGDGSGLTGVLGDGLGSHIATTTLLMGAYGVNTSSDVTAARYQIDGSTVLAVLPGAGSLGVGVQAGRVNTGVSNSFLGYQAGYSNTTGGYNSFLGLQAGYNNTTGNYNSFLGFAAGPLNTTGANNSFLGSYAGYSNTTGNYNSFLGSYAGYSNTTGNYNSFLGSYAGYSNTTGGYNSFLGLQAGFNNTTGNYNSFLGFDAGFYNTTGSFNSFLGYRAGYYNQTGAGNAVVGYGAGGLGSGGVNSFSSSTIMGYQAGYKVTTGNDNILLGWQAGYNVTSGTGNIVIGYNKGTSGATANNELNIGGVLYGDLSAKTIGISTRVPQAALDIVSTATAANVYAQIWRDGFGVVKASVTSLGMFSGDGSGLTGVSATDGTKLPLAGGTMTGQLSVFASTGAFSYDIATNGIVISTGGAVQTIGTGYGTVMGNSRGNAAVDLQASRTAASQVASGLYSVIGGGLNNTSGSDSSVVAGGNSNSVTGSWSTVSGGKNNTVSSQYSMVPGGTNNTASGNFSFAAGYGAQSTLQGGFTWADSVGTPVTNAVADQVMFKAKGGFWVSTGTIYTDPGLFVDAGNRVGIGTSAPAYKLHVTAATGGTIAGLNYSASGIDAAVYGWTNSGAVAIKGVASSGYAGRFEGNVYIGDATPVGASKLVVEGITSDNTASALDATNSAGGSLLFVRNDGNVGIGTTSPVGKLHVSGGATIFEGDVAITTNSTGGGSHLRSSQPTPPGFTASSPGCGTTAATGSVNGTDMAGTVTINSGTAPTGLCVVTVNFTRGYATAPKAVLITPMGSITHSLNASINPVPTISNFSIQANVAVSPSSTYSWSYIVIE